jgi:hypothetical protein
MKKIIFLGYIIILGKISLDPEKIPGNYYLANTNYNQTNIFLGGGFKNYYKNFIKLYSKIILFLTDLTRKDQVF